MLNILVVHNESGIREVFQKILKPRGHIISEAKTGAEGLKLVDKLEFDLIFVASHLDDVDGVRVLELLKKKKREITVVLCCGLHDVNAAVDAVKAGAYDILEEPYQNIEILKITREILKKTGKGVDEAGDLHEGKYTKDTVRRKLYFMVGGILLTVILVVTGVEIAYLNNKAKRIAAATVVLEPVKEKSVEVPVETKKIEPKKIERIQIVPEKPKEMAGFDKILNVPYSHASGMVRSGEYLYVCDWFAQSVYQHKADDDLTLLKTFSVGDLHPAGITLIDGFLYVADSWDGTITKFKIEKNELIVVKTFKVTEQNPSGIAYDGASMWVSDLAAKKINKHWLDNEMTLAANYPAPGDSPSSLFWDGKNLWSADRDYGLVYFHRSSVTLQDFDKYDNDTIRSKRGKFAAFTGDRDFVWAAFDGVGSLYRFEITKFRSK